MAAIEHSNVVRVYSFGEVEGKPYIVMEYVKGESLAAKLQRGPLPLREACRITREVALGLNAASERGLVHRDVKPSNILLDVRGRVHIADFGLAESVETTDVGAGIPERGVAGMPHYIAPEQARGQAVDFRADVYSLGIVFYELLTGVRPFHGATVSELLQKQIRDPLPAMRSGYGDMPEALSRLLISMTEKDPRDRPSSYRELIEALDAAVPPAPAVLSVPTWWPLSDLPTSLHTGWSLASLWVGVVALCGLTGVLNVLWPWNAIPVALGPLAFDFTFYPAFPLSILCAVWLGPSWGAIPLYAANLAGAVYGGVPFPVSVLFAAAGAIEVLILWGLIAALDIDPDLKRRRDILRLTASVAVAAVIASTSVIVWNASRGNDFSTGQRLWYAWIIGDVVQAVLLAVPCMRLLGPSARSWVRRRMGKEPRSEVTQTRIAGVLAAVLAAMGLLVFAGFGMVQESLERELAILGGRGELRLRLFQGQLFLGILVFALVVATGLASTTLAQKGAAESRRREGL